MFVVALQLRFSLPGSALFIDSFFAHKPAAAGMPVTRPPLAQPAAKRTVTRGLVIGDMESGKRIGWGD